MKENNLTKAGIKTLAQGLDWDKVVTEATCHCGQKYIARTVARGHKWSPLEGVKVVDPDYFKVGRVANLEFVDR